MSDLGETFQAYREARREKRERNLVNSLAILEERGHGLTQLSATHFRIGDFDFWPSTGKYLERSTGRYGRGVFNLIRKLEGESE